MNVQSNLKRSISLPLITFYGLGTIIGAGIYGLIGKIAAISGTYTPLAFIIAAVLAGLSAFTYSELSSRYPLSAGEAVYIDKAFDKKWFSAIVGWAVVLIGVVSAAAISNAFTGYFKVFFPESSSAFVLVVLVFSLGSLAIWGVTQSVWVATIATLIEIGGLIFVLLIAGQAVDTSRISPAEMIPPLDFSSWMSVFGGAFLAFYAYVGFEDMVNMAEEVKEPEKNMPRAIYIALAVSTLLYIVVSIVTIYALPLSQLAASDRPLADVVRAVKPGTEHYISAIALIAVVNGALVQIIMAARVIYGMGKQGMAPQVLSKVSAITHTPILASILIVLAVLIFALSLPIESLAGVTSFITLLVFAVMHLSLLRIQKRYGGQVKIRVYSLLLPILGLIFTMGLLVLKLISYITP